MLGYHGAQEADPLSLAAKIFRWWLSSRPHRSFHSSPMLLPALIYLLRPCRRTPACGSLA